MPKTEWMLSVTAGNDGKITVVGLLVPENLMRMFHDALVTWTGDLEARPIKQSDLETIDEVHQRLRAEQDQIRPWVRDT